MHGFAVNSGLKYHPTIFGTANMTNLVKINQLVCLVIDHSSYSKMYFSI